MYYHTVLTGSHIYRVFTGSYQTMLYRTVRIVPPAMYRTYHSEYYQIAQNVPTALIAYRIGTFPSRQTTPPSCACAPAEAYSTPAKSAAHLLYQLCVSALRAVYHVFRKTKRTLGDQKKTFFFSRGNTTALLNALDRDNNNTNRDNNNNNKTKNTQALRTSHQTCGNGAQRGDGCLSNHHNPHMILLVVVRGYPTVRFPSGFISDPMSYRSKFGPRLCPSPKRNRRPHC